MDTKKYCYRTKEIKAKINKWDISKLKSFCTTKETINKTKRQEGPLRWWRSKTWRSPSFPQIHQKYIYVWNNSYRTPTERWQETSDFPKGKEIPTYLGRAKEKRKNRDKRIGMGPAPLGGSCEGGKVSTQ